MVSQRRTARLLFAMSSILAVLISGSSCYSYGSQSLEEDLDGYGQNEQIPSLSWLNYPRGLLEKLGLLYAPTEAQAVQQPAQYEAHHHEQHEQPEEQFKELAQSNQQPEEEEEEFEGYYVKSTEENVQDLQKPEGPQVQEHEENNNELFDLGDNTEAFDAEVTVNPSGSGLYNQALDGMPGEPGPIGTPKPKATRGITPTTKKSASVTPVTTHKTTGGKTTKKAVTKQKTTRGITPTTNTATGITPVTKPKTTPTIKPSCTTTLELRFSNCSIKDLSGNNFKVYNTGVTFKNGDAYFDGNARLTVPGFSNMELGGTLVVLIWYSQANASSRQTLVANTDSGVRPSISICSSGKAVDFYAETETNGQGASQVVALPRVGLPKGFAKLKLQKGRLEGSVFGDYQKSGPLSGSLYRRPGSLVIGAGGDCKNFHGEIIGFVIYRCDQYRR